MFDLEAVRALVVKELGPEAFIRVHDFGIVIIKLINVYEEDGYVNYHNSIYLAGIVTYIGYPSEHERKIIDVIQTMKADMEAYHV